MLKFIIVLLIFYKFYKKFANEQNPSNPQQKVKYPPKIEYTPPAKTQMPPAKVQPASAIVQKNNVSDDHCIIEPSTNPIQDGSKANSILGAFFGNKVEKL